MRTTKILNAVIVLLFIAAISLPLVSADFDGGKVSVAENRYLAKFPEVIKDGKIVFRPSEFDRWINDNVGGRQISQVVEAKVSFRLDHLHNGNVVEGKDKWLYLIPDYDMPEYTNTNLPTVEGVNFLCERYEHIAQKLNENGIGFVLAMYPRKYHVYPEYMPSTIKKMSSTSAYEMIASKLSQSAILNFTNPYEELVEAKHERLTYFKAYDASHWNNYGAFIGYQSLMEQVQKVIPDIRILTEDDFIITEKVFETIKENGFSTSETDLVYELKSNQVVSDKEYLVQLGFRGTDQWKSYNYYRNSDMTLPKAIIVGDSFTWMFQLNNLAQSFSELAFIHYNDIGELNLLITQISPDVIIAPFLSSAIWSIYLWEPNVGSTLPGILPVADYSEWGYHFTDYLGTTPSNGNVLTVNSGDVTSYMEGWAIDPLAGKLASSVVIQVGDQYYTTDYGKARDSVSAYFQNEAYLHSGYTINLNTQELIAAGRITVHVLSADGTYQYPPCIYTIQAH